MTKQELQTKLIELTKQIIKFPHPQICKHYVAEMTLSLLEQSGIQITTELADSIVFENDEEAIKLLNTLRRNKCPNKK